MINNQVKTIIELTYPKKDPVKTLLFILYE